MKTLARCLAVSIAVVCLHTPAHALLVGKSGMTYPIRERDFLTVIEERAASVDVDALKARLQTQIQEEAKAFKPKDSVKDLPRAKKSETYRVDLSFTVTEGMAQGITDVYGQSVYKPGTTVNPLKIMADRKVFYPFVLVILNADRPEELDWFRKEGLNDDPNVKLLISNGSPYMLAEELKRPVYQLTETIRDRFQIRATPSYVWWPKKTDTLSVMTRAIADAEHPQKVKP